jgi:hypothetical protein
VGSAIIASPFLTLALHGDEWSGSRLCWFTPWERAPGTHFKGGWMGARDGLDAMEKIKILTLPGMKPRPSSPKPISIPTEISRLLSRHRAAKKCCGLGIMNFLSYQGNPLFRKLIQTIPQNLIPWLLKSKSSILLTPSMLWEWMKIHTS